VLLRPETWISGLTRLLRSPPQESNQRSSKTLCRKRKTNLNSDGEALVLDASAIVDLLLEAPTTEAIRRRMRGSELHAPAHFDAEVLSALGRLHRDGHLSSSEVSTRLNLVQRLPIRRHELSPLLTGAWNRRGSLRLVDALYVELAEQLDAPIITSDGRLAATVSRAETPA